MLLAAAAGACRVLYGYRPLDASPGLLGSAALCVLCALLGAETCSRTHVITCVLLLQLLSSAADKTAGRSASRYTWSSGKIAAAQHAMDSSVCSLSLSRTHTSAAASSAERLAVCQNQKLPSPAPAEL